MKNKLFVFEKFIKSENYNIPGNILDGTVSDLCGGQIKMNGWKNCQVYGYSQVYDYQTGSHRLNRCQILALGTF